jgi:hypothetical protein
MAVENPKYRCIICNSIINDNTAYISKSDDRFMVEGKRGIEGKAIWCKECMNDYYQNKYGQFNGNVSKAIFVTCRRFNYPFNTIKLNEALNQLENKEGSRDKVFQIYMQKLFSRNFKDGDPACFDDGETEHICLIANDEVAQEMIIKWIPGLPPEDYEFLECELEDWQKTHSCDNKAELTLLKHICLKELEIRKMQADHQDTSKALKDLQDLMKTANVDPAKANAASAGKSAECYGVWLKDFEEKEPAEWFEDQEKFKDMDGLWDYIKNYIIRPIKNFFTGSRDFIVDDGLDSDLDSVDVGGEKLDGS